jgi:hypothetical protein
MYYSYYHDPGDHNTAAHLGVRTETEKLIHFWKLDVWEYYDLVKDPHEQNNRINDPAAAPAIAVLKTELKRLQVELKDEGQFSDKMPGGGGGPDSARPKTVDLGVRTVQEVTGDATMASTPR